jgi:hypothetical protein
MKRVAVFGNAGGGKSTWLGSWPSLRGRRFTSSTNCNSRRAVRLCLTTSTLSDLMAQETWVIDGYGDNTTVWELVGAADTLIYVDLSLPIHYWG